MNFPFSYIDEIVLYKDNSLNYNALLNNISVRNNGTQIDRQNFEWKSNKGILGAIIPIKLNIKTDEMTIHIEYFISMFESNILLLFFLVFGVFFAWHSQMFLSISSVALGVLLWFANTARLITFVKKQLGEFYQFDNNINRQYLWNKQKIWMESKKLCPACGEPINPYSANCTQCGIKVNPNNNQTYTPSSQTQNISAKINYKKL